MGRGDVVVLLAFSVGVSYAAGWGAAIVGSVSERYSAGFRLWVWVAGLAAAGAVVAGAAVVGWF